MEIERKFTIKQLPEDYKSYPHHEIEQAYLCIHPVVRIRRQDDSFYLTYKGSGMMIREEYNLPLNKEAFYHLLAKADGKIIKKKRYLIPIDNTSLIIELDIFESPVSLIMAEVEFPDEASARAFHAPDWFDLDVTTDPSYHNSNMSIG